jgi:hypothetical protein
VMFNLKNGGTSPAIGATASPFLMIRPFKVDDISGNRQLILSLCTGSRNAPAREGVEGVLILPRDTAPFRIFSATPPAAYVPEADGTVRAWIVVCVDYRDQFGELHGIGSINTFVARDGRRSFQPVDTVDGILQQPFFEVIY